MYSSAALSPLNPYLLQCIQNCSLLSGLLALILTVQYMLQVLF